MYMLLDYLRNQQNELAPSEDTDEPGNPPNEQVHEISNNVVCVTSKASDQPAHTRSLIRAFASR